ncbi:MAG: ferric reductase-like transmembrane domain-containing protein [Candidatus Jordarchaeaceae archaeon]
MKQTISKIIIVFFCLNTLLLWASGKESISQIASNPYISISQITALLAVVLASINLILSTKISILEDFFDGLDKVYSVHRTTGALSFVFMLTHPILLVIDALPNVELASYYLIPGKDISYNFGIIAAFFSILAFIFIVFIKIPYRLWLTTHRFLGISFIFIGLHTLLISSDISTNLYLRIWIILFLTVGLISFLYIVLAYRFIGPKYYYEIAKITRELDVVNLYLKPRKRSINFQPGQFVYLSFLDKKLGGEFHPFSISSSPKEELVRISAKILGDFTIKLPEAEEGQKVILYGPYGKFAQKYLSGKFREIVWIAGGIGVTPFLSLLRNETQKALGKRITFFYSFKSEYEALFDDEIKNLIKDHGFIDYIPWNTKTRKRLNANIVAEKITEIQNVLILICGPLRMMQDLKKQFLNLGVAEKNIIFENFAFLE